MKNLTYYNLMVVIRKIQAKGYDFETSKRLARGVFDEFAACPQGVEHRGAGQAHSDQGRMGAGVRLLIVAGLPLFLLLCTFFRGKLKAGKGLFKENSDLGNTGNLDFLTPGG